MDESALTRYAERLAIHLESTGAELRPRPEIQVFRSGGVSRIDVRAELPGPELSMASTIELIERWRLEPRGEWELDSYTYDLIDRERGRRRAFHLHDRDFFIRRYRTVVHEHCEEGIGRLDCAHYAGVPMRDGHQAIDRLLKAWTDDGPFGCGNLDCLD